MITRLTMKLDDDLIDNGGMVMVVPNKISKADYQQKYHKDCSSNIEVEAELHHDISVAMFDYPDCGTWEFRFKALNPNHRYFQTFMHESAGVGSAQRKSGDGTNKVLIDLKYVDTIYLHGKKWSLSDVIAKDDPVEIIAANNFQEFPNGVKIFTPLVKK